MITAAPLEEVVQDGGRHDGSPPNGPATPGFGSPFRWTSSSSHAEVTAPSRGRCSATLVADYAERWGDQFLRIESVAKAGDSRVLDLREPKVRAEVRTCEGGKVTALYESEAARDYRSLALVTASGPGCERAGGLLGEAW